MRTLLARLFALGVLVSVPFGASAANIDLDNWQIDASEGADFQLNLSVTYTGSDESIVVDMDAPSTDDQAPVLTFETGDVIITEFVSDPISGQEEWVELYNTTDAPIDLTDWYLTEGSGSETELGGTLDEDTYLVVFSPAGALNNSGDQISLYAPRDLWIDGVSYGNWSAATAPAASDPFSVGLDDHANFVEMEPTPGEANRSPETSENSDTESSNNGDVEIASEDTDSTSDQNQNDTYEDDAGIDPPADEETTCDPADHAEANASDDASDIPFVALANIRNQELGTEIVTEGLVSVVPGTLGQQYFYVAGSGAQVYMYSKAFPELERGTRVRITGELSQTQSETRIKTSETADIVVLGQEDAPIPHTIDAVDLGENTEGWLVSLTGAVTEKSSGEFMLADETGEIRVVIKSSTDINAALSVGDEMTVTGIVSETSSGFRLLPRDQEDLQIEASEDETADEPLAGGILSSGAGSSGYGLALTGLALVSMLASGGFYLIKQYGFNQLVTA